MARSPESSSPQYGVCFDLYSTLVHEDSSNPFYREVASVLRLDPEKWMPAYRKRGKDSMAGRLSDMSERVRVSADDSGFTRTRDEVVTAVEDAFPSFVRSVRIDPHALDLLGRLRADGARLALLSNASSYSEEILDRVGLRDRFDTVVLSYRVKLLKPDPEIYRLALAGLGLPAESVTFVGDGGDQELSGARKAGMRTVLVDRSLPHSESAKADADHVVSDLAEVHKICTHPQSLHR
ncbi:HAD family hydrolase [Streptomyces sp. NPDC057257]|uniref:HAD family hydrolase n=1 Tax=Streptomyces sp. NPDC057257 TaxID=3346071 RepID=UPI003631C5F5